MGLISVVLVRGLFQTNPLQMAPVFAFFDAEHRSSDGGLGVFVFSPGRSFYRGRWMSNGRPPIPIAQEQDSDQILKNWEIKDVGLQAECVGVVCPVGQQEHATPSMFRKFHWESPPPKQDTSQVVNPCCRISVAMPRQNRAN